VAQLLCQRRRQLIDTDAIYPNWFVVLPRRRSPSVDSPPMTSLDEQGRPEPPLAGDETATLLGFLEY